MDQRPLTNASTKLTAHGNAPTAATLSTTWRPSSSAAPAITGTAMRKLNSAAAVGVRPLHRAAATVAPDREIAGRQANAWPHPIPPAAAPEGSSRSARDHRVAQRIMPVLVNRTASQV